MQTDDYYPFGLAFNSYKSELKNDYLSIFYYPQNNHFITGEQCLLCMQDHDVPMKKVSVLLSVALCLTVQLAFAQYPSDYLGKDFHKDRREQLRTKMPANSVPVMFANPIALV